MTRRQTWVVAAAAVTVLVSLTAIRLDSQGVYYDELHQAPAAFRYIGSHPVMFTWAYRGVPLLNMTYSGAIKSAVYGFYLRFVDPHFSIVTWRLSGIILVAAGLFAFYMTAGPWLALDGAIVFGALLLTDISVIVMTRHDFGPTALALALRLAFLAVWFAIALGTPKDRHAGVAGFIVGIAVWEKLSSVVLLAPLLILLLTRAARRKGAWLAAGLGLFIGTLPLVVANVAGYGTRHAFISLSNPYPDKAPIALRGMVDYASNYLSLGQGESVRMDVFGDSANVSLVRVETALMLALIALVWSARVRISRTDEAIKVATAFAGAYLGVAIALAMLPAGTSVHHWVLGTPFQYAAVAAAFIAVNHHGTLYKLLLMTSLGLIAIRVPALVAVERSFVSGKSSADFDPVFNRLVQFAAGNSKEALFISTDWGTATQIYCGSNGADDAIDELFWTDNPGKAALDAAAKTKKRTLFVVTRGLDPKFARASDAVTESIRRAPGWTSVPDDEEVATLRPIVVRKFVRTPEE